MRKLFLSLLTPVIIVVALLSTGACTSSIPLVKLQAKYTNEQSRYIDIQGMKVHYRDEGSGPTLILVHGIVASLHTWDGWTQALKGKYRIIRFDVPGWALTGPADWDAYNADHFTKFLDEFATALQLDRFSLVGNSLGGYISWNYALRYPEKVDKLIVIDPAAYPQKLPRILRIMCDPLLGSISEKWTPKLIFENAVREVYGDPKMVTQEAVDRYYELILREGNRTSCRQILKQIKKSSTRYPEEIKGITTPILVMWGRKDRWINVSQVELWKKDLPGAQVIIYDEAGHVAMEEYPEITSHDADLFLSGKNLNGIAATGSDMEK